MSSQAHDPKQSDTPSNLRTLYMVTYGDAWRQCIGLIPDVYRETDNSYWQWFGSNEYLNDIRRNKNSSGTYRTFSSLDAAKAFLREQIELRIEIEQKKLQSLDSLTIDNAHDPGRFDPRLWSRSPELGGSKQ